MKRLVICCDGTWNSADQEDNGRPCPTNVLKTAIRISKRDGDIPQIMFYDQGVGTGNSLDKLTGGAFGDGLLDNILDAYRFLAANYEPGDELFCFGFSRGAYTVRSLVGMVRKCGVLSRTSSHHYAHAQRLYCSAEAPDEPGPLDFRRANCVVGAEPIPVKFLGVWDTVGALGIPMRGLRWMTRKDYQFHDVELSGSVANAFHALAIDEHRGPFEAARWTPKDKPGQVVKQVWFCGAHSDVGGGYPEHGLSDIPLEWMIENAAACGLAFDGAVAGAYPLKKDVTQPIHNSKDGFYRLTRGIDRSIGTAAGKASQPAEDAATLDPTQSLHPSVLQKWDSDPRYRPSNVEDYLRRSGDPRAAEENAEPNPSERAVRWAAGSLFACLARHCRPNHPAIPNSSHVNPHCSTPRAGSHSAPLLRVLRRET